MSDKKQETDSDKEAMAEGNANVSSEASAAEKPDLLESTTSNTSTNDWLQQYFSKALGISNEPPPEKVLDDVSLEGVARYINSDRCKKICTMTGAGISTSAGIPDFRSPGSGLYDNLQKYDLPSPMAIFDMDYFKDNPEPFYELAKELLPGAFKPTPCHYFIRMLNDKGKLMTHFTQNVDTLERVAGLPEDKVIEAHGSFHTSHCLHCHKRYSLDWMKEKIMSSDIPRCIEPDCKGLIKPDVSTRKRQKMTQISKEYAEGDIVLCALDMGIWWPGFIVSRTNSAVQIGFWGEDITVSKKLSKVHPFEANSPLIQSSKNIVFFGEPLPTKFFQHSKDFDECDLLLIMGTSLVVQPFASMTSRVKDWCPRLYINLEKTGSGGHPLTTLMFGGGFTFDSEDNFRDVFWEGTCDDGCYALADLLGWGDELRKLVETEHAKLDKETAAQAKKTSKSASATSKASSKKPAKASGLSNVTPVNKDGATGKTEKTPKKTSPKSNGSPGSKKKAGL